MDELKMVLENMLNEELEQIILSDSRNREEALKIKIRPVIIKGELLFQEELFRGNQVFHGNFNREDTGSRIKGYLEHLFRQACFNGSRQSVSILVSKKGKMTIKTRQINGRNKEDNSLLSGDSRTMPLPHMGEKIPGGYVSNETNSLEDRRKALEHNRTKHYILQEGAAAGFLVGLGVQNKEGKVARSKYDKFRQINRYLEFIEDVCDELPRDRVIRIIDFGCGKSYLTFAMYYYLHELQKRDIEVTGLDLKTDVIDACNKLAEECGYDHLHFEKGDISTYQGADHVDMVVSLHACDNATDYALEKAVRWGASVIMAVPCCQHQVNKEMDPAVLKPVLKYGLIKERMASLLTDAMRANVLEAWGYDTQILEFIDMEHTPKNLMIRAVKRKAPSSRSSGKKGDMDGVKEFFGVTPVLEKLLETQSMKARMNR